jgi:type IV secretory pathway VirD2 relaxase
MDYVSAQYPPKFIRAMLSLTDEQIDAALSYIQTHHVAVETEYQAVLQESEKLRRYWEEQNRELFTKIAAKPPNPGTEAIRAKLQVAKATYASKV